MKLSRRSLLRALPSMPFAAQAAKKRAAALMGASVIGAEATGDYGVPSQAGCVGGDASIRGRSLIDLLKRVGLPGWKQREIRADARRSRLIDPDIAALRSVSPSWMLHKQWQRNEARLKADLYGWIEAGEQRDEFMTKHNCGWF